MTRSASIILLGTGRLTYAQTEAVPATPPTVAARAPAMALGFGLLSDFGDTPSDAGSLGWFASTQFTRGRFASLELEATHRVYDGQPEVGFHSHSDTLTIAGNVLVNARRGRVFGFAGIGVGVARVQVEDTWFLSPVPLTAVSTSFIWQPIGGVDLKLTERLGAFAELRMQVGPHKPMNGIVGLRAALMTREVLVAPATPGDPATFAGKQVRVTTRTGERTTGTFKHLSKDAVAIAQNGQDLSIPIGEIARVEKTTRRLLHWGLAGAIPGAVVMLATAWTCKSWCGIGYVGGAGMAAAGVGLGLGLAAITNSITADQRLVYQGATTP